MVESSQGGLPALIDHIQFDSDAESKKLIGNGKESLPSKFFSAYRFIWSWFDALLID